MKSTHCPCADAALSGLGLSIEKASISTVGTQAINTFHIQEVFDDGPRKVQGRQKIKAIEERLRLQFRRRATLRLLKVNVSSEPPLPEEGESESEAQAEAKLEDEAATAAAPPHTPLKSARHLPGHWAHTPLAAASISRRASRETESAATATGAATKASPKVSERRLLAGLSSALADGWSGPYGALAPSLAAKLAAEVLPGMTRVALPPGGAWRHDCEGEWLLLLETRAHTHAISNCCTFC